jgi:CelD/BcsL family acetyltransferase involved in cellulose biosynthesis
MGTRLLALSEYQDSDLRAWRKLAASAVEPNPFFEPEFILPAARAARRETPHLLIVEDGENWEACLPITEARWRRGLPAWQTWRGMYGYLGTPLLASARPEAAESVLAGLSEVAGQRSLYLDWIAEGSLISELRSASPGHHAVRESETFERALLIRREDGEYLGHLKSHHRREHRRLGRRLAEEAGPISIADRAGDQGAVERFLEIERTGWKGLSETAMASKQTDARFFREVCAQFATRGRLQLLELRAGDRTVAMKCNLLAGTGSFAFKIAFDEELARFSPGIQLELANIEHFHASGLEWMDSCADEDNAMINRLWTERRRLDSLLFVRKGTIGETTYRTVKAAIAMSGRDQ